MQLAPTLQPQLHNLDNILVRALTCTHVAAQSVLLDESTIPGNQSCAFPEFFKDVLRHDHPSQGTTI